MSTMRALSLLLVVLFGVLAIDASRNRQRPVLGGWRSMDIRSPEAQEAARKATVHLELSKNSLRAYRLHQIISAKSQLVAGTNYQLQLKIAQTDCNRGPNVNIANCQTVKVQRCSVTIHVPLQSQSSQLMSQNCGRERNVSSRTTRGTTIRRPLPGGAVDIDVSREEVRQAASFATQQLTSQSNGRYRVEHQRIISATSQVVAGVKYSLKMEVSLTESGTNEVKSTQCDVDVWDQAWRTPRYTLERKRCDEFIA